jgi:hypothetical protein
MNLKTLSDLNGLLGLIEETQQLEYKANGALGRGNREKVEITKDVSAMANAAGGLIVYGIKEYADKEREHLPEALSPVNRALFPKEWLDQVIGMIQPRIDGLTITPIHVGPDTTDYCYVVEVPQGRTAHQALDNRYYRRRNFEVTPMADYEVRDVMSRRSNPKVTVDLCIRDPNYQKFGDLIFRFRNESHVMARFVGAVVRFPVKLGPRNIVIPSATLEGSPESANWLFSVANGFSAPLFPTAHQDVRVQFEYASKLAPAVGPGLSKALVTVFADNMDPVYLEKDLANAIGGWV